MGWLGWKALGQGRQLAQLRSASGLTTTPIASGTGLNLHLAVIETSGLQQHVIWMLAHRHRAYMAASTMRLMLCGRADACKQFALQCTPNDVHVQRLEL